MGEWGGNRAASNHIATKTAQHPEYFARIMQSGHYEHLLTVALTRAVGHVDTSQFVVERENLDPERAAIFLTRHLAATIGQVLHTLASNEEDDAKAVAEQVSIANRIIEFLQGQEYDQRLTEQGRLLRAVLPRLVVPHDYQHRVGDYLKEIEPALRFSQSELFSGGNSGLSLTSELRKEIATADSIDLIVSFVKWSGLRLLIDRLENFANQGKRIRILTTTYMGASDAKAVEALAALPGAEVRISYNMARERLHAKAYMFGRASGLSTAYIGSSNMSRSALTSGLEWNVKLTAQDNAAIIKKFEATFETYWNAPDFEPFVPDEPGTKRLRLSLNEQGAASSDDSEVLAGFHLRPYAFQQEILDRLAAERSYHGRYRNLVIAATGTGKTVISAFDYARFAKAHNRFPKLLFVAHREEILRQARSTYRHILNNPNFGDLWVGGQTPNSYDHLFLSVQTFDSQKQYLQKALGKAHFEYIVLDEVHHVIAASYRPLVDYFRPAILLGLTATPERADGGSILPDFDNTIAAEIRLPEAIARGFLVPFQYFCVTDPVDYRRVQWERGRYSVEALSELYNQNVIRTQAIVTSLHKYLLNPSKVKALGFCVSRAHAQYMAEQFNNIGLPAAALVSGDATSEIRQSLREDLRTGKISYLFVVDIFNEGVDIPEIDTVLFLRPTESLTVFLQQLGRGLRHHSDKECLTVLDFVGQARAEYSCEQRFRALIGRTGTSVISEIEAGFDRLPPGCTIQMEKEAMQSILENIKAATGSNLRNLIRRLEHFELESALPLKLTFFLAHTGFSLMDIYKARATTRGWYALKVRARKALPTLPKEEADLVGQLWRLAQINSPAFISFVKQIFGSQQSIISLLEGPKGQAYGLMLHYLLYQKPGPKVPVGSLEASLLALRNATTLAEEALELLEVCEQQIDYVPPVMALPYVCALELHARYSRDEVLAALGVWQFEHARSVREGVCMVPDLNTEILFVELQKSKERYAPSTLYNDYAISDTLFHWESQNATSAFTPKGQSYINQSALGKTILLFVREQRYNEGGLTLPYVFLGPVKYKSHTGGRPMAIIWELVTPLPSFLWHEAGKLAVG